MVMVVVTSSPARRRRRKSVSFNNRDLKSLATGDHGNESTKLWKPKHQTMVTGRNYGNCAADDDDDCTDDGIRQK
jgi:hypothetical protein